MFLRRVLTDPSPAEQLLEPIGLGAVIVTRQGRDKQTLAETPGTEENRSVIIFQARDEIGLIHIIITTFP